MEKIILAQAAFAALCVLEAYHDKVVIDLQNYSLPNYQELSKKWHKRSFYYVLLASCTIAFVLDSYWLVAPLMACRSVVFNPVLNLIRGKGFFYLSDKGLDGFILKTLGKYAGEIVYFIMLFGILGLNLIGLNIIKLTYVENLLSQIFH
jgi:hypothetical protein